MLLDPLFLGLDLGTSGARAVVIDAAGSVIASGKSLMADFGRNRADPSIWLMAAKSAMRQALGSIDATRVAAISVDGTSGSMVAVDVRGVPLADALMYNDMCGHQDILQTIAQNAPTTSAALGASSALARAISLQTLRPFCVLHQADWIAFHLSGQMVSDANNALKTGYDPVSGIWPDWIAQTGMQMAMLPKVLEPGSPVGEVTDAAAVEFGLAKGCIIVSGTTDGCASFLATGADQVGCGVTALGTTLTLKILSDKPIFAPEFGIYSHRLLGNWLAGGASNSGGAALLAHFTTEEMHEMSPRLHPELPTGLDYYPLPSVGERFPFSDPTLQPRLTPRPPVRETFLQGLFEGIAAIEATGFARLHQLGGPQLQSLRSVGGGAQNAVWTDIRQRKLQVPFVAPLSDEAAYGTALLAQRGVRT